MTGGGGANPFRASMAMGSGMPPVGTMPTGAGAFGGAAFFGQGQQQQPQQQQQNGSLI
ncbi:hypothetical protein B0H12DRAFT_1120550 [Mycena haematopus]|nr:hypothetical protein B0H12DRAFT_1120550 [Mycena haematopus]